MHVACALGPASIDGGARAVFEAMGDFEAQPSPPSGHVLGDVGDPLPEVEAAARALFVDATGPDRPWWGLGQIPPQGAVDVLLLPSLTSCPFALAADAGGPPPTRQGAVLGAISGGRLLLVGGGGQAVAPQTVVVDLATGEVAVAQPDLLTPRSQASVTAFGAGGLVAGGVDRSSGLALDTAEIYDPVAAGFDQQHPMRLSEPRARHGATLLATGETLLVGGVGGSDGQTILATMEIVDPTTQTVRAENVALLSVPRADPVVLRLASGEILVAGGVDSNGDPVPTLEWFSPDASHATRRTSDLVTGVARAFVALSSGGALAVVAPAAPAPTGFVNVWVIDADGVIEGATPVDGSLTQPVLFGGAGGAPALWTGDRWLRWQPWQGVFGALGSLDEAPAAIGGAIASPDPGLAAWLDPTTGLVTGLRFDSRGPYSPLGPLFAVDPTSLAPDRLEAPGVDQLDPVSGDLTLASGASAFVTDRTYADVAVDVDLSTPTLVVLRDESGNELEVGGPECPGPFQGSPPATLQVRREASTVTWAVPGLPPGACPVSVSASARLAVGLRGVAEGASSVARNLRVQRMP